MARLESEAMTLGIWKSFVELEECISLPELEHILTAMKEKEKREQEFAAALKGIRLGESEEDSRERFEKIKRRAEGIIQNKTEDELERDEYAALGLEIEVEE